MRNPTESEEPLEIMSLACSIGGLLPILQRAEVRLTVLLNSIQSRTQNRLLIIIIIAVNYTPQSI